MKTHIKQTRWFTKARAYFFDCVKDKLKDITKKEVSRYL